MFWKKTAKIEPPSQVGLSVEKFDRDAALRKLIDSNFNDCVKAYANTESGSPLEKLAFEKIKKTGRTFEDWLTVYVAVAVTPAGIYAFEKMTATAKTFNEWKKIYEYNLDASTTQMILDKLASLAKLREELMYVYNISSEGSSTRIMMEHALKAQAKTAEDWEVIAEASSGEMREFAVNMMIQLTEDNVEDLDDLLAADVIGSNEKFKTKVLDRISALSLSFDKWLEIISHEDIDGEVKAIALERLTADPTMAGRGYKDWEKLLNEAESGSDFEKKAASIVIDKVDSNNPEAIVNLANYSIIENDENLFARVIEKIHLAVAPVKKWKEVYENFDGSDSGSSHSQIVNLVLLKMIESITNIEELVEVDGVIDDDNHTDETTEKFEAKAQMILVTKEACQRIIDEYYANDDLFGVAADWIIASAKNTKECIDIFFASIEDWKTNSDDGENTVDELIEKASARLVEIASDNELHILSKFPEDDFGDIAKTASRQLERRQTL